MIKAEEEKQARLRADKEARISKEASQNSEQYNSARLKVEEGFCIVLEGIRIS